MKRRLSALLLTLASGPLMHIQPLQAETSVTFMADYKGELIGPLSASTSTQPGLVGNLTAGLEADLDGLMGWSGGTFLAQGIVNHGGDQYLGAGDIQGHSNIQSPPMAKVFQLWLKQDFMDKRLSLSLGLHDLNTEFYFTESAVNFLNSSFGVGPELSLSGANGPSTYPYTSMGFFVSSRPLENLNLKAAIYDGLPGDPTSPSLTRFYFRPQDGLLGVMEVSLDVSPASQPGRYGVGFWGYTNSVDHIYERDSLGNPTKTVSAGAYLLLEQKFFGHSRANTEGVFGFARFGFSSPVSHRISRSTQFGLTYRAPFSRTQDEWGLGAAIASGTATEQAYEMTYRAHLFQKVYLQPDFQWIVHPILDPSSDSVFVSTLRAQIQI